jgi:lipoprotein-anchoring transpeptidase ErfK/SrfK
MIRTRTVLVAASTAAALMVAGVAVGAPAAKVPAPKSGTWKLHQTFDGTKGGQLIVTAHHGAARALRTTVGPSETQYCGTGAVQVLGRHQIHLARGGGQRAYIVGKGLDSHQSFGVIAVKTKVRFHHTTYDGDVRLRFESATSGSGQIDFNPIAGLSCDLTFAIHHAK